MRREKLPGVTEQAKSAVHRLADAEALFENERYRGAIYLAGYAVECILKAKLMAKYECRTLAELERELVRRNLVPKNWTAFTHQLIALTALTGAMARLRKNVSLWQQFGQVSTWLPAWRYNTVAPTREYAATFLDAVRGVKQWVENNV